MSKGICFIEPMFNKVPTLEKIQTRRIITPQPDYFLKGQPYSDIRELAIKPKYNVGETVYLKEPYVISGSYIIYKYGSVIGQECDKAGVKWKNKLFMPQRAARYFIEITAVRAERLQDISEEDCLKEGIEAFTKDEKLFKYGLDGWEWSEMPRTAREAYATLINGINGKGTWERNPWVWVYDFKLVK